MEITTNAIDGGAPRRSTLTLVAARTQAGLPCASTYVGKGSVRPAQAPVMGLDPVCGGHLVRGWHEAQLSDMGAQTTGAQHRHGLVVDPSSTKQHMSVVGGIVSGAQLNDKRNFNVNFIARSGPPCRPTV